MNKAFYRVKRLGLLAILMATVTVAADQSGTVPKILASADIPTPPCGQTEVSELVKRIADLIGKGIGVPANDLIGAIHRSKSANCRVICAKDVPGDHEISFYIIGLGDNNHHPLYCSAGGNYRSGFDSNWAAVRDISVGSATK